MQEVGQNSGLDYQKGTVVPILDLEISGECNLHCPTCWGTPPSMKQEHGLSEWLSLIEKLKVEYGLESIALTGGEPLMVPGIDSFIKGAKAGLGLNVNLLTNAVFLGEHFFSIRPYLASISVPLDGSNEMINRRSRGKDHFSVALDWISLISGQHPGLPLKVGTVVSGANIQDVPNIGEVLLDQGFSQTWKLYQATAFGAAQESRVWKTRRVTDQDFERLVVEMTRKFAGQMNVTGLSTVEVGGYCIIVRPNGNVVTNSLIDGTEHLLFGNIFDDTAGAMRSIGEYHVRDRGVQRMATSYGFQGLR